MADLQNISPLEWRYAITLGQRLKALRREHGLTQEQMAERAGIATFTYQKYEKGLSKPGTPLNPTLFTLLALSRALEMPVKDLLDFEVSSNPLDPIQVDLDQR